MRVRVRKLFPLLGIFFAISLITIGFTNTNSSMRDLDTGKSNTSEPANSENLTIPEDFPADIPIHPGEIVVSTSTGKSTARTWVVEVLVEDLVSTQQKVISDLMKAGFQLQSESGLGSYEYRATLTTSDFIVRLKIYLESNTGQKEVMYVVTRV